MIGQIIRLKVLKGKEEELETLVSKLMRDVVSNEPGSIYDVRRVRGQPQTLSLIHISEPTRPY